MFSQYQWIIYKLFTSRFDYLLFTKFLYISILHILNARIYSPLCYVTSYNLYVNLLPLPHLLEVIHLLLELLVPLFLVNRPVLEWERMLEVPHGLVQEHH